MDTLKLKRGSLASLDYVLMFRLETKETNITYRKGAYGSTDSLATRVLGDTRGSWRQPTPEEDGLGTYIEDGVHRLFGFRSIAQYKSWFNSTAGRDAISPYGVLAVYKVLSNKVCYGGKQLVAETVHMDHLGDLPTNHKGYSFNEEELQKGI